MAKKKRVKKSSKKSKKVVKQRGIRSTKKKIDLVFKNLMLFAILTLGSFLLYRFANQILFRNLFLLLVIVLGFVGVAFLIVLLALLILKFMKK